MAVEDDTHEVADTCLGRCMQRVRKEKTAKDIEKDLAAIKKRIERRAGLQREVGRAERAERGGRRAERSRQVRRARAACAAVAISSAPVRKTRMSSRGPAGRPPAAPRGVTT